MLAIPSLVATLEREIKQLREAVKALAEVVSQQKETQLEVSASLLALSKQLSQL
jgi:hypothetical protein